MHTGLHQLLVTYWIIDQCTSQLLSELLLCTEWWLMQTLITDQVQIIRDHQMLNPKVNIDNSSPLLSRFRDHFRKSVRLEGRGWLQVNHVFWTDQGSRTSELTVVVTLCTRLHKSKPDSMEEEVGHPNYNPNRRAIWQLFDAGRRKDSFL